jgi:hypothetical protein
MNNKPQETVAEGKKHSAFFAAVRKRGVLNAMLDGPALSYEENNPGMRARWEYCPPSGDKTFIVAREGLGFKIVDASELGKATVSGQTEGTVRVGDLILMAAPDHIVQAIEMEDARTAYEDWRVPQATYEESIRGLRVRLRDGSEKETKPVGDIRMTTEIVHATPAVGMDHELER